MRLALKTFIFIFIFLSKPQETTDIRCRLHNALLSKFRVLLSKFRVNLVLSKFRVNL